MKIRRAIQVAPIKLAIFLLPIVLIARLSRAELWCGDGPADYLDAETPEPVPAFACAKAVRDPSAPVASLPSVRMTKYGRGAHFGQDDGLLDLKKPMNPPTRPQPIAGMPKV